MSKRKSKPIFISHAAADKAIADKVVDLLNMAMGIDVENDVFCSSLEGIKIPPGKNFEQFIKDQIQAPKIVLLLISQNYLASQFCLAEVGATWAMSHRMIPFLVPPVKFDDMKAVLVGINALKIEDSADWNEALAVFRDVLKIDPNPNRWERKRNEKISEIVALIPTQQPPSIIPLQKFREIEEMLKGANEEISELEETNKQLAIVLEEVKKLKDREEVAEIELANLPAAEAFEELQIQASREVGDFMKVVREALYYHFMDEHLPYPRPGHSDANEIWDNIRMAKENGYLVIDGDDRISLNEDNPSVRRAIEALLKLRDFMERTPEMEGPYEETHTHQFQFTLRPFWKSNLSL